MNNRLSIETARAALARAAWTRGEQPAYGETAVADLLSDIRHLCQAEGIDYDQCNLRAESYFVEEDGTEDGGVS